ncbi:MAG: ribosome biogenesis/translation initiation ATPase RLI [Candidatus Thermoplasmatota archaeon]
MRIAILIEDRCKPKVCGKECIKYCPRVRAGDETITMGENGKPKISEELCVGCGICATKCPFDAIKIIGLAEELKTDLVHQFSENGFRLFRLPVPTKGECIGILGPNGIGKTTAIKILSGRLKPNLGRYDKNVSWEDILDYYSGTELYNHFKAISKDKISTVLKPQYVDKLPKVMKGKIGDILHKADDSGRFEEIINKLGLNNVLDKKIHKGKISGGELQLVAMAASFLKDADLYFIDEPSSYLDIHQRLKVARMIKELSEEKKVMIVEHDLAILDFLCDNIHLVYGEEGGYGVVTNPRAERHAINTYLSGYLKEENIRFGHKIEFFEHPPKQRQDLEILITYGNLIKSFKNFKLEVKNGVVRKGETIGVVGPNAIGKTTFVKMLAGIIEPDKGNIDYDLKISYKPQYISATFNGTVRRFFEKNAQSLFTSPFFKTEIVEPLNLNYLLDKEIETLSGGELQRVAIANCLVQEADIYLLDEPSAYLDSEQRMVTSRTIRRVAGKSGKSAMIVDHDVYFIDMISDALIVFEGKSGEKGLAQGPFSLHEGMNKFLKNVDVTFRRDEETKRPRVNKPDSYMDRKQKEQGEYYYSL